MFDQETYLQMFEALKVENISGAAYCLYAVGDNVLVEHFVRKKESNS